MCMYHKTTYTRVHRDVRPDTPAVYSARAQKFAGPTSFQFRTKYFKVFIVN